jgi:hypothetical protein
VVSKKPFLNEKYFKIMENSQNFDSYPLVVVVSAKEI